MVLDYDTVVKAIDKILQNPEGRNTVTSSLACGGITGIAAMGASIFLGPVGVLAGALAGSTVSYLFYKDKFKPLYVVYRDDMTEDERSELTYLVLRFCEQLDINDGLMLMGLASNNAAFGGEMFQILRALIAHLTDKYAQCNEQATVDFSDKLLIKSREPLRRAIACQS